MNNFRGGRGKKAPYESVMYRIPLPIKPVVEALANSYRLLVDNVSETNSENLLKRVTDTIIESSYPSGNNPHNNNQELDELKAEIEILKKIQEQDRELWAAKMHKLSLAVNILKESLNLKANAGGKNKNSIREALLLIDEK